MPEPTFMGVPRKSIPWHPAIDYDKCNFCLECDKFCPHGVFSREEEGCELVVKNPENCVVFCQTCAKACPLDALSFPDREATLETIKKLRSGGAS